MRVNPKIWLTRHIQVGLSALGRLSRTPLSTLMTTTVIGITLALPTGLYLLLTNLQHLAGSWESATTISLFLKMNTGDQQAGQLARRLRERDGIDQVEVISRNAAMQEFRRLSGFSEALEALGDNPLPPVLVIQPDLRFDDPDNAEKLLEEMRTLPEVDIARLDMQWVKRFHAITEIARRGVLVIASLLGMAVLLVIGNTIRLEIQNRRAEIEVTRLVGATNAFIRRPFLYSGLWYGLLGGTIAWLLVSVAFWLLQNPVERLAALYHSGFGLTTMDASLILTLLGGSALLGLFGSWLSVSRHLSGTEPN
jgi:cell division transport system permease protein